MTLPSHSLITGMRMMVAGLICFLTYQWMNWPEGYWSVVTVSAITQSMLSDTMVKAVLRFWGTCLGALVGLIFAYLIHDNLFWLSSIFLIFITLTTYVGLQTKPYQYASVVAGFTAVVVIASKAMGNLQDIALFRTLEVIFGIFVYAGVNLIVLSLQKDSDAFIAPRFKEKISQVFKKIHWSSKSLIDTLIISIPTTLTFLSWLIWKYPYGFWTTITLLIIMEDSATDTEKKSFMRLIGQILAASCGLLVAYYAGGDLLITGIALAIGFFISGCIIGSGSPIAGVGNHAGSAIAIMLLVGLKEGTTDVVLGRFFNVLAGILIANLVMWLKTKIYPATALQ
ncbi:FUSC family protein [Legionella sp. W05-934-2]|jgi:uncharacterized membrane protein YccC|uniref:FUSC family protein n=1 Tax=Legionella sp. W05-934-2 TaxID=1198649 RepID=UPI00346256A9